MAMKYTAPAVGQTVTDQKVVSTKKKFNVQEHSQSVYYNGEAADCDQ